MTNNTFNYRFRKLEPLLEALERLTPKTDKLNDRGLKTEVKIQKSKYGYWNLKLKIYNEDANTKETRTFNQEVEVNGNC